MCFIGCQSNPSSSSSMAFEEVQYVQKFPKSFSVENRIPIELEKTIGVQNFRIYDSLLIASTQDKEGLWAFHSLSDNGFLGKYLLKGDGPNEFAHSPSIVTKGGLFKVNSQLFAWIHDFQKGKILKMNIDESLKNNQLSISVIRESLPPFLFSCVMLDSITFFCREMNNVQTQQTRFILCRDEKMLPSNLEILNKAEIRQGEDFNILSAIVQWNSDKKIMVEMPIGLNHINLYSLENSWRKTICVGKKLDNIESVQDVSRWDRKYTYADLRIFTHYWAALYINETEKTVQTVRGKYPVIHFFDWEGNPLVELKLDSHITSFDIDFIKGFLYTLDVQTDELGKYDIKKILMQLDKNG